MLGLLANKVRPIGLDIGHNAVKMIQCAVNGAQVSVIAADKVDFSPEINGDVGKRREFIISAVRQMLSRGGFRSKNVVSCLSNDVLQVRSSRIDACENDEVDEVLRAEIAQRFGLDPDKDQINCMVAGNVHQGDELKSELILFAVDGESVSRHIELLEGTGLKPVSIDTVPCALFRSFERSLRREEDKEVVNVFVDLGGRFTTVVVSRGRNISFVKQIPLGVERFNEEVAKELGLGSAEAKVLRAKLQDDDRADGVDATSRQLVHDVTVAVAEELAREISLCFRYYAVTFRGKRPGRAVFTGGGAYDGALLGALKRQLAVEVEIAEPMKGFDLTRVEFDGDRRGLLCEWAVAVGLSLKGWDGGEGRRGVDYERN